MAKQQAVEQARAALIHIEWISKKALQAADVLRDNLTRSNYAEGYAVMALCYGELTGMLRLIHDTAILWKEARDEVV